MGQDPGPALIPVLLASPSGEERTEGSSPKLSPNSGSPGPIKRDPRRFPGWGRRLGGVPCPACAPRDEEEFKALPCLRSPLNPGLAWDRDLRLQRSPGRERSPWENSLALECSSGPRLPRWKEDLPCGAGASRRLLWNLFPSQGSFPE